MEGFVSNSLPNSFELKDNSINLEDLALKLGDGQEIEPTHIPPHHHLVLNFSN